MAEPQVIDIPGIGEVEFPESMSEADVSKAAKKLYDDFVVESSKLARNVMDLPAGENIVGALKGAGGRVMDFAKRLPMMVMDPLNTMSLKDGKLQTKEPMTAAKDLVKDTVAYAVQEPGRIASQVEAEGGTPEAVGKGLVDSALYGVGLVTGGKTAGRGVRAAAQSAPVRTARSAAADMLRSPAAEGVAQVADTATLFSSGNPMVAAMRAAAHGGQRPGMIDRMRAMASHAIDPGPIAGTEAYMPNVTSRPGRAPVDTPPIVSEMDVLYDRWHPNEGSGSPTMRNVETGPSRMAYPRPDPIVSEPVAPPSPNEGGRLASPRVTRTILDEMMERAADERDAVRGTSADTVHSSVAQTLEEIRNPPLQSVELAPSHPQGGGNTVPEKMYYSNTGGRLGGPHTPEPSFDVLLKNALQTERPGMELGLSHPKGGGFTQPGVTFSPRAQEVLERMNKRGAKEGTTPEKVASEREFRTLSRKPILSEAELKRLEFLEQIMKTRASRTGLSYAAGGKRGMP